MKCYRCCDCLLLFFNVTSLHFILHFPYVNVADTTHADAHCPQPPSFRSLAPPSFSLTRQRRIPLLHSYMCSNGPVFPDPPLPPPVLVDTPLSPIRSPRRGTPLLHSYMCSNGPVFPDPPLPPPVLVDVANVKKQPRIAHNFTRVTHMK
jgi:hypothetical protein